MQLSKLPEVPEPLMVPAGEIKTAEDDRPETIFQVHRHNMQICGVCLQRHEGLSEAVRARQKLLDEITQEQ